MRDDDADRLLAPLPSGRHGLTREQVTRSQRLRLLAAAIAVAGADGYAAMTVSTVIAHANVSRKTFYEQFADREHCFAAAYEALAQRALAGVHGAAAIDAPWPERLRAALAWRLQALAAHPHEARVAFVEVLAAGPRALALREQAVRELAPLFVPGFDAAPAGATIPRSMPTAVAGALAELIATHVRGDDAAALPALLPDLLFCALAPFVGPVAAATAVEDAATARTAAA
ncbi:MAG: TetR/AcrR family transcriptional regulator [Actinobacteria bacterium]|nr:TetR/AcrR family transcriptional regulator [Actinomycetota bacterium]